MFQFTDDCLTGIKQIDEEHKHLFDMINDALLWLDNGGDIYEKIKGLLHDLEEYADQHFTHEEEYMQEIGDPGLILQRIQHMAFREHLSKIIVENMDKEDQHKALEEIIHFLANWLFHHVIGSDIMIGKQKSLDDWMAGEVLCEFMDEYLTGIDVIDYEHKHAFEILGRANNLVKAWDKSDDLDNIISVLEELKAYLEVHFEDEEAYMESINYEDYEAQKRSHEAFIARLEEVDLEEIDGDTRAYMESLIQFLLGWFINHILHMDKKISSFVPPSATWR